MLHQADSAPPKLSPEDGGMSSSGSRDYCPTLPPQGCADGAVPHQLAQSSRISPPSSRAVVCVVPHGVHAVDAAPRHQHQQLQLPSQQLSRQQTKPNALF